MTLYCQTADRLPAALMSRLAPGARATHVFELDANTGADVERYSYSWRDFEVNFYLTRRPQIVRQLHSFLDTAAVLAHARGRHLDHDFVRRVHSTRLVIGYDAGPNYLERSRFERLEGMIVAVRDTTRSLLHWEGGIYDEHGRLLIG